MSEHEVRRWLSDYSSWIMTLYIAAESGSGCYCIREDKSDGFFHSSFLPYSEEDDEDDIAVYSAVLKMLELMIPFRCKRDQPMALEVFLSDPGVDGCAELVKAMRSFRIDLRFRLTDKKKNIAEQEDWWEVVVKGPKRTEYSDCHFRKVGSTEDQRLLRKRTTFNIADVPVFADEVERLQEAFDAAETANKVAITALLASSERIAEARKQKIKRESQ